VQETDENDLVPPDLPLARWLEVKAQNRKAKKPTRTPPIKLATVNIEADSLPASHTKQPRLSKRSHRTRKEKPQKLFNSSTT
jgi:hypothetical protein